MDAHDMWHITSIIYDRRVSYARIHVKIAVRETENNSTRHGLISSQIGNADNTRPLRGVRRSRAVLCVRFWIAAASHK